LRPGSIATMRPVRLLPAAILVAFALSTAVPVIAATPAPVAPALKSTLAKLKAKSKLPVLLPSTFPIVRDGTKPLYPRIVADSKSYSVDLGLAPDCNGANACSAGYLGATKTPKLPSAVDGKYKVKLHGVTGRYQPLSCGASCSPPAITFRSGGVNFTYQLKLDLAKGETDRQVLTRLANQALDAGPR
jgi:hypothetical protein